MALVNTPLNGPEGLPSMPPAPPTPEKTITQNEPIAAAPAVLENIPQPATVPDLKNAKTALDVAVQEKTPKDIFIEEIRNLLVKDTFYSHIKPEHRPDFENDFRKFVEKKVIEEKIDKTSDQKQISRVLEELYKQHVDVMSKWYLIQEAFTGAEILEKHLGDK